VILLLWEMRESAMEREPNKELAQRIVTQIVDLRADSTSAMGEGGARNGQDINNNNQIDLRSRLRRSYSMPQIHVAGKLSSTPLIRNEEPGNGGGVKILRQRNTSEWPPAAKDQFGDQPYYAFLPPPILDTSGFRFNIFENLNLDFEKTVFRQLTHENQLLFGAFRKRARQEVSKLSIKAHNVPDDFTLFRFFQAENYNGGKALPRLMKAIEWWETSGFNDFMNNVDWKLVKRGKATRPIYFCGFDRSRRPMVVEKIGEFFGNEEVWRALSPADWKRYQPFLLGELTSYFRLGVKQGGPALTELSVIADASGFKLRSAMLMISFVRLLNDIEGNFPFMTDCTVINAPAWFTIFWSVIKSIICPVVVQSVRVFPDSAKEFLTDHYGADCVPIEYGGTLDVRVLPCPQTIDEKFQRAFPL